MKRKIFTLFIIFLVMGLYDVVWAGDMDPKEAAISDAPPFMNPNYEPDTFSEMIDHPMVDHISQNQDISTNNNQKDGQMIALYNNAILTYLENSKKSSSDRKIGDNAKVHSDIYKASIQFR